MNDKNVEIKRYDSRAAKEIQKDAINYFNIKASAFKFVMKVTKL